MKYLIIILSLFISFSINAQGKRTKFAKQMERCLDLIGNPIPNCMILSDALGEFYPTELEDILNELNIANESAVDSIYVNNDTLYIVYFNAPTLKYKATQLNGIFGSGNNNKRIAIQKAEVDPNGDFYITNNISGVNSFTTRFSGLLKQVTITNSTSQPVQLRLNGTNNAHTEYNATSRVWRTGNMSAAYNILDVTGNITPFSIQSVPTVNNALYLKNNGDISFGGYTSLRPFSTFPKNFAAWDDNGVFQKYEIQNLIDTVSFNLLYQLEETEQQTSFVIIPQKNVYIIDLSLNSTVSINVTDQIIGKPYKYIGYNGTTGDIDFQTDAGLFVGSGTNETDGIVGNFTYEIIKLSEELFMATETWTIGQ